MKMKWVMGLTLLAILSGGSLWAQESQKPLTLEESIKIAMERSLTLHSATAGVAGSEFGRKVALTSFLPKWTGQYSYTRLNETPTISSIPIRVNISGISVTLPKITVPAGTEDNYNFSTTVNQPLYAGGSIWANYRLASLGVDVSKTNVETVKRDLILQVRVAYLTILRAEKFLLVAQQQVKQFEAQLEVTKAFFDVGIVPKNDVLQAEVSLANAIQGQVKAENDVATAKAAFNILLRRDINEPFSVVDILEYKPFALRFEDCLGEALRQRQEIKSAELSIRQAKEGVKIARSGFFPTVGLSGTYSRVGDQAWVGGSKFEDPWTWNIGGLMTFTLGDWGKVSYQVGQSKVNVTQAEDSKNQVIDSITLEVKDDYLNVQVAERNIKVAEKAIEQAEENLRMNEERYKFQVSTQTDVIIAVTLLAQAQTNYYGALSDFNVAKVQLERSMGRMYP